MNDQAITPLSQPYGLSVDGVARPLNAGARPRFSWMLSGQGEDAIQTSYQLIVRDGVEGVEVWDSGRIESSEQSNVRYAGPELAPGRPYCWKVRVWDGQGRPCAWSEEGTFAVGPRDEAWQARWIQSPQALEQLAAWTPSDGTRGPRGFEAGRTDTGNVYWLTRSRTQPIASSPVVSALVYVCCAHDYELHVNGLRVGRGQNFDYPSESRYQAWDVTDALTGDGQENAAEGLTVGLVCRWYGGGQGRCPDTRPASLVRLEVHHADGAHETLVSDGDWLTTLAPYGGDVLRNGEGDFVETYDAVAAQALAGWSVASYERLRAEGWQPAVVLGEHPCEAFPTLTAELGHVSDETAEPVSLTRLDDGTTVVDFGRIITGRFSVRFPETHCDGTITLETGYELDEQGHVRVGANDTANQGSDLRFIVTPCPGAFDYDAWDTLCFRYLMLPPEAGRLAESDVRAHIAHGEVPEGQMATLTTSNPMLDRVFRLMAHSALHSMTNQFMDTPTRERGQFLADGFNISRATMGGWNERATTAKAIRQFLASADRWWSSKPQDIGKYNSVYPNVDLGRDIPDFSLMMPTWVSQYHRMSGDIDLVREALPYLKNTAAYVLRNIPAEGPTAGLVTEIDGGGASSAAPYHHGIVDWPAPGRFDYDMDCAARSVINMLSYRALRDTAMLSARAGESDEAARLLKAADTLRRAINTRLVAEDGLYIDGLKADGTPSGHASQHANSHALAFGIVEGAGLAKVAQYVASLGMKQGPMTADVLVKALFDAGLDADAIRLLTNVDDYGWAQIIDRHDATFTWEQWQYPQPGTGTSQSHGWGAAALQQMIEHILGVEILAPGASRVCIRPACGVLERIAGEAWTQRGPVRVDWDATARPNALSVEIPGNVRAEVITPDGVAYELGAGRHMVRW